jgi:hypothetical protein
MYAWLPWRDFAVAIASLGSCAEFRQQLYPIIHFVFPNDVISFLDAFSASVKEILSQVGK